MTWNYRIIKTNETYAVHEVYYDDGRPSSWTENAILGPGYESVEEIKQDLEYMKRALDAPVLMLEELLQNSHNDICQLLYPNEVVKNQSLYDCTLIKAWRLYKSVTLPYVAAYLEIPEQQYVDIEEGIIELSDPITLKLAELYGILPEQLKEANIL